MNFGEYLATEHAYTNVGGMNLSPGQETKAQQIMS